MAHFNLPDVVLVGPSFIRRLKSFWFPDLPLDSDIDFLHEDLASQASVKGCLNRNIDKIYTACVGINLPEHLYRSEDLIRVVTPKILVIHMGSNKLTTLERFDPVLVQTVIDQIIIFAQRMISEFGVGKVIFPSCLARTGNLRNCSPAVFEQNRSEFNSILHNACLGQETLIFLHLRGFDFKKVNNHNVKRDVCEWSRDGIHIDMDTHPEFMGKYWNRIKFALLKASSA